MAKRETTETRIARIEERQLGISQKLDTSISMLEKSLSTSGEILGSLNQRVTALEGFKGQIVMIASLASVGFSMIWEWIYRKLLGEK